MLVDSFFSLMGSFFYVKCNKIKLKVKKKVKNYKLQVQTLLEIASQNKLKADEISFFTKHISFYQTSL
jgi:hypothetical protein